VAVESGQYLAADVTQGMEEYLAADDRGRAGAVLQMESADELNRAQRISVGYDFIHDPIKIALIWEGGLVMYGGFFGAMLLAAWASRRRQLNPLNAFDTGLVAGFVGQAVGRWGCLLVGDDYGSVVPEGYRNLPFPITITVPSLEWLEANPESLFDKSLAGEVLWATQPWMSINALCVALVGWWVLKRRRWFGQVAVVILIHYSITRFLIESCRGESVRGAREVARGHDLDLPAHRHPHSPHRIVAPLPEPRTERFRGPDPGKGMSAVVAGLDEAGLGPLLGPLTIGFSAFRVPAEDTDLWRQLARGVAPRSKRGERRIVVADSKKVFARSAPGRRRLETTALAFLSLLHDDGAPPADAREVLFDALPPPDGVVARHPWYEHLPSVPRAIDRGALELQAARLGRELAARDVTILGAGVRVVPSGELNDSYATTGNKADTVWARTLEVLRHLWTKHGEDGAAVTADLQGARSHYGPLLARGFPEASVRRLREDGIVSSYALEERDEERRGGWLPRRMTVEFRAKGEEHSFSVALASCLAKYARETVMEAFNSYFHAVQSDLAPTAGYTTDGRRWLDEARPALLERDVPREILVRAR